MKLNKKLEKAKTQRDNLIRVLKKKLEDPYTDNEVRLEILEWFKRWYNDEVLQSAKSFEQWGKDLRRLASEEE